MQQLKNVLVIIVMLQLAACAVSGPFTSHDPQIDLLKAEAFQVHAK